MVLRPRMTTRCRSLLVSLSGSRRSAQGTSEIVSTRCVSSPYDVSSSATNPSVPLDADGDIVGVVVLVTLNSWVSLYVEEVRGVEVKSNLCNNRVHPMLAGLGQWLMDNARYFQDEDLLAEQIMQCKEAFSNFDKYGRGVIPVKDLKDVMRYLGLNPTENDIVSIMADLDLDSAGKMKLNDFIEVMLEQMRKMDTEDEIRKVFKVFDKDGNGLLNAAELKYMMTNMGHKFTDEEVDELLRQADINGDGHLNYEEFVQMLLS